MNFVWYFGLVWLMVVGSTADREIPKNLVGGRSSRFCTNNLSNILNLVCNGKYNELMNYAKRDVEYDESGNENRFDIEWPYIPKTSAVALLTGDLYRRQRRQRGIVEECCRKSCNYNEILSYCKV